MLHDAIVVGAGPAGSTAARLLAKAGWKIALIEKAEFPRRKVCGEFISASTLPLLDGAIGEEFQHRAGPEVRRVGLYAGAAMLSSPMPRSANGAAWGRALRRERLDVILRDAAVAVGAKLIQPAKLIHLLRNADGYIGTLKAGNGTAEIAARIVIAASGSWEKSVFPVADEAHRASDLFAFKAHFMESDLAADLMPLLVFPGGYGGMVATDGGRTTLSCCIRRDWLERARERRRREARIGAEHPRRRVPVVGSDPARHSATLFRPRVLHRQSRGRSASHHRRRHLDGNSRG